MDLFLDCEWADTLASELVSIALVSADGSRLFYGERDPLPLHPTPWVRSVVYPLLERGAVAMSDAVMTLRLREFLVSASNPTIHYDSGHDRSLCEYVVDGFEVPQPVGPLPSLSWKRLDGVSLAVEKWWRAHPEHRARRHHAGMDAKALRGAYINDF